MNCLRVRLDFVFFCDLFFVILFFVVFICDFFGFCDFCAFLCCFLVVVVVVVVVMMLGGGMQGVC